jgi:hypothetical protein
MKPLVTIATTTAITDDICPAGLPPRRADTGQFSLAVKIVLLVLTTLALANCGAAKAARDTGQIFDKYGCLARDFKGEPPCKADEMPSHPQFSTAKQQHLRLSRISQARTKNCDV